MELPGGSSKRSLAGYVLEHRLGQAVDSTVWRARQLDALDRPVAVKRVRIARDGDAAAKLRADVAVLAALDHPNVVDVFEIVDDDHDLAIAMQLAAGGSLDERLARRGLMAPVEATDVVATLAAALESAHRRGIVHGNLKPTNVLFAADGEPLLSDFGISVDRGLVRNTEAYVDPTVLAGRTPDVAADLYALGAMAYEMATGRIPSTTADAAGLDGPLGAVVQGCLAADPAERFSSAAELLQALRHPAAPPAASAVTTNRSATHREASIIGPRPLRLWRAEQPSERWRVAASLAGLLLFVGGGPLVWSPKTTPAATAVPRPDTTMTLAVSPCPPLKDGPHVVVGDVDGDGCPEALHRQDNILERDTTRFALGEPGDLPVLGDWDCDGIATPGVFRAAAGVAHLFDGWADDHGPRPAVQTIAATSPPVPDCD